MIVETHLDYIPLAQKESDDWVTPQFCTQLALLAVCYVCVCVWIYSTIPHRIEHRRAADSSRTKVKPISYFDYNFMTLVEQTAEQMFPPRVIWHVAACATKNNSSKNFFVFFERSQYDFRYKHRLSNVWYIHHRTSTLSHFPYTSQFNQADSNHLESFTQRLTKHVACKISPTIKRFLWALHVDVGGGATMMIIAKSNGGARSRFPFTLKYTSTYIHTNTGTNRNDVTFRFEP